MAPNNRSQGLTILPEPPPEILQRAQELSKRAPLPARVGRVACGTAGWTDPTLIRSRSFYPTYVRNAEQRLVHYATHFPMVEVDSTFYAIPAPSVSSQWAARTPDGFVFDIKAPPTLTGHPIDPVRLPKAIAELLPPDLSERRRLYPRDLPGELQQALVGQFRDFLDPLRQADKLGCVMIQLPPWVTATRGAVRQLEQLHLLVPNTVLAVEFRHPSWMESSRLDRVLSMLRANQMALVVVDEPAVPGGGVPAIVRTTRDDLAVVRFHGHNIAGWHRGATVSERFNYLYSPDQIELWVPSIRVLAEYANRVHAVFNNCVKDYAVLGAKDLAALLSAEFGSSHDGVALLREPC